MKRHPRPEELFDFPCDHMFKAFGPRSEAFESRVREAVAQVVPVPRDAVKVRSSSGGKYSCVSVLVRLHNFEQVKRIYEVLRQVEELKYLL